MEAETSKERAFSVELNSREDLKSVAMAYGSREGVLVEGTIGALVQTRFMEGIIFEVVGGKGVLRIDLTEDEVANWQKISEQAKKSR